MNKLLRSPLVDQSDSSKRREVGARARGGGQNIEQPVPSHLTSRGRLIALKAAPQSRSLSDCAVDQGSLLHVESGNDVESKLNPAVPPNRHLFSHHFKFKSRHARTTGSTEAPAMLTSTLRSERRSSTDWHDDTSSVTMRGPEAVDYPLRSELFDAKSANERLLDGARVSPLAFAGIVPVSMVYIHSVVKMRVGVSHAPIQGAMTRCWFAADQITAYIRICLSLCKHARKIHRVVVDPPSRLRHVPLTSTR